MIASRLSIENSLVIRKREMYCFSRQENIIRTMITLNLQRKYDFFSQINAIVVSSIEAGLIEKWHRDSRMYSNDSTKQDDGHRVILTVAHIGAALIALFCGLTIASIVFIAECVTLHKVKQADCHKFWVFLSKVVDGRRFYFQAK